MDVRSWNPEFRYRIRRFTKDKAFHFMNAATVILKIIKFVIDMRLNRTSAGRSAKGASLKKVG
ncbi:MAG: hypothetical protein ACXVBI_07320, partial [Flavisolibacter sp.]